jgi:hypothetical protein
MIEEATACLSELSIDQFSGTVLVAKGHEVLLEKATGLASRRYAIPNNMDTLFNLGSINKIFTKIGIAQLAAHPVSTPRSRSAMSTRSSYSPTSTLPEPAMSLDT